MVHHERVGAHGRARSARNLDRILSTRIQPRQPMSERCGCAVPRGGCRVQGRGTSLCGPLQLSHNEFWRECKSDQRARLTSCRLGISGSNRLSRMISANRSTACARAKVGEPEVLHRTKRLPHKNRLDKKNVKRVKIHFTRQGVAGCGTAQWSMWC